MDKNELLAEIVRHGDTCEKLAKELGIARFSEKINNKGEFKQSQIRAIMNRYNLSPDDVVKIFFTQPVQSN